MNEEFTLEIDLSNIKDLSAVEYEVGDPAVTDVVHIDKNTLAMTFKGHSEGRTEITILCGNLSRKCTVTVNAESDPVEHDERRWNRYEKTNQYMVYCLYHYQPHCFSYNALYLEGLFIVTSEVQYGSSTDG